MPFVFVYGTLKRGGSRHGVVRGSHFCGPAVTFPGFRLYDLGEYPGLIESPSGGAIEGELFKVTEETLLRMDAVEGVDLGLYERHSIPLQAPFIDVPAIAYFYRGDVSKKREVPRRWVLKPPIWPSVTWDRSYY